MEQWIEELKERGRKEGGPKAARKVAKKAEMMKNLETCAVGRNRVGGSRTREPTSHTTVHTDRYTAVQPHKCKDS